MRLLVVGASGRLGRQVVQEALNRGFAVTAAARSPETVAIAHPCLSLAPLDVRDAGAVRELLPGHEAVVSTLGHRRHGEAPDVLAVGMRHLISAMEASRVRRLVALASAGILQLDDQRLRLERPGYPASFLPGATMHRQAWEALEASDLDWTLVCPPELVMGTREQPMRARIDYLPEGPLHVSMPALARWMIDALSGPIEPRHRVGILDAPEGL